MSNQKHYHIKDYEADYTIPLKYKTFAWALARACVLTSTLDAPVGTYKPVECREKHEE